MPLCVDVLTVAGVQGMPEFSAYSASKHALVGLMRSAAAECAPKGLRINCINPATTGVCVCVCLSHSSDRSRHSSDRSRYGWGVGGGGGGDLYPGICVFCKQGAMW